jgi:hypothetical protein
MHLCEIVEAGLYRDDRDGPSPAALKTAAGSLTSSEGCAVREIVVRGIVSASG